MEVVVLRLSHRAARDKRITTHVALVARAFGADKIVITGDPDSRIIEGINEVTSRWGGDFRSEYHATYRSVLKEYKDKGFEVIHLTMYGIPIQDVAGKLRASKRDKLIIVGGEKVPGEVFEIADYNIAVTNQPHSEVSSLAILLDRLFNGEELGRTFPNAEIKVIPQERGKKFMPPMSFSYQKKR